MSECIKIMRIFGLIVIKNNDTNPKNHIDPKKGFV